ncbi:MAG: hypothetical protein JNJ89_03925 [Rubrivivax sp.]|nr:hypothetical protein [Rubrivivax sp.]
MTHMLKTSLVAAAALAASGLALAHTGHGHAELSPFEGLVHALREPDHLAMIALGTTLTGVVAPLVLRGLAALRRRLRAARNSADAAPATGTPGAKA